jgi:hypothetical protein
MLPYPDKALPKPTLPASTGDRWARHEKVFSLRCVPGFTAGTSPPNPLPEMVKEPPRAGGYVIAKSPSYALPYGDYFSPFREARFLPALNGGVFARRFR